MIAAPADSVRSVPGLRLVPPPLSVSAPAAVSAIAVPDVSEALKLRSPVVVVSVSLPDPESTGPATFSACALVRATPPEPALVKAPRVVIKLAPLSDTAPLAPPVTVPAVMTPLV